MSAYLRRGRGYYAPVTPGTTTKVKRKEYIPATLHTLTLLGFVTICLGLIVGLEFMIRMSSKTLVEGNGGNGNLAVKRDAEQQDATPYLEVYSSTLRPRSEKSLASSTSVDDMELELVPSTIATSELSPSTQPIATSVTTSAAPSAPADTASEPEPSTTYQFYVHQGVYATDVDPHPEPSQAPLKKDPPKEDPPKKDPPKKDPPKTDPTPIMPVNVDETPRSTRSKYPYPNQNIYATKVDPRPEPSVNTPKKDPPKKDPPKRDPPTKPKHSADFYVHHEVYATDVDAQPESSETPPKKDLPNQKKPGTSYVNTRIYATDVDAQSEPSETPYFPPDDEENPDESRPPQPYVYPGIYATEVDAQPEPSNTAEPEPSYRKQSYVNTRVYATRVDPRPKHTKNPPQKDAPHTKEHKVKPQNRPTTYPTPTGGEYLPIQTGTRVKQRPGHSKTRHHDGPQPTGEGDDRQDDDGQDDHWKDDNNQDDDDQDDNEQNGNDQNSDDQDDDNRDRIPIHTGPVGSHPVTVYTTDKRGATQTLLIDSHPVTVFATDESGASQTLLIESPTYIDGSLILPPAATSNTQPTPNAAIATENASDKNKIDYRVYVFSGQYLSTVIAVLLSMLWKVIDTDIKRIEPFYLLSHASGTPASTLTENLLFANSYFIPLQAAWRRQWVVCLSAIVYFPLLAGVQFLAPATVFLNTATKCDIFATTRTCDNPYLAARRVTARFLQGVLGCVIVAVIAIIVLQRRRKSLLHSEPWSLAGLAALLADWGAIRDGFSGIDVGDSEEDLKRKVSGRHHQYRLANGEYRGKPHLGIEVVKNPFETVALDTLDATAAPNTSEMYLSPENTSQRPLMLRSYTLIVFELFLVGVLTLILVYRFTNADNSKMERFMSGESIWVKFLFISLGITIRFGWEPIEREARHLEVFHLLSHRHQPVSVLLRDHPRSFPLATELASLYHGCFFVALIGFMGLLIEALVVLLTGIPFSSTQTLEDANICMFLSTSILVITIVTVGVVLLRRRRMGRRMPRTPYTLAATMAYLYAAKFVDGLAGLSTLATKARNQEIVKVGRDKEFGFGWIVGSDGKKRVVVDEEELEGDYKVSHLALWKR